MLTIKIQVWQLIQSLYDYINEKIGSVIDYSEVYIKPSKQDLYIKTKSGKKTVYKRIDYFYTVETFSDDMKISLLNDDPKKADKEITFDIELMPN